MQDLCKIYPDLCKLCSVRVSMAGLSCADPQEERSVVPLLHGWITDCSLPSMVESDVSDSVAPGAPRGAKGLPKAPGAPRSSPGLLRTPWGP